MSIEVNDRATADKLTIDATSKAGRGTLYAPDGSLIAYQSDPTLRMFQRPPAFSTLGSYSLGAKSGTISTAFDSAATKFGFWCRWADAAALAVIERISMGILVSTAPNSTNQHFMLSFLRGWTIPETNIGAGGTIVTPSNGQNTRRTGEISDWSVRLGRSSRFQDMRIATTGPVVKTNANFTVDTNPMRRTGAFAVTGAAVPTSLLQREEFVLWDAHSVKGQFHPIVLAQDEGLGVTTNAFATVSSWVFWINIEWTEVFNFLA